MSSQRSARARCPETQIAVPECSCRRCLEEMLRRFQPELLDGEIRITRMTAPRPEGPHGRAA